MKRLVVLLSLAVSSHASFGQEADDERRLRTIHAGLDTALVKGDVAYFESVFAPEYVFSHHFGRLVNRADNLDYLRTLSAEADYRVVRAASDDVQVRVSGDAAWVTAAWTTAIVSARTPNQEPHEDKGRYTGIYERRGGRWLLVAEHLSEAPHDRDLMRAQVIEAANAYRQPDMPARSEFLSLLVADEYVETWPDGRTRTKDAIVASDTATAALVQHDVAVIDNYTALETGILRADSGTPQSRLGYTSVWVWRDLRWQLLTMHLSEAKE
jgi:hypothetical protein